MVITKETYSEIYAIINLMSENLRKKIPSDILDNIENKRDKDKIIQISNIENYEISDQANQLLAVLYKEYFATQEEKTIIDSKEKIIYKRRQKEAYQKYNPYFKLKK